jgi:eukaryotic-like serine/threonine-protein kinase
VPAGRVVPYLSAIALRYSDGTQEPPRVPEVAGMSEAEARAVLTDAGYRVQVRSEPTQQAAQIGLVLDVDPEAGAILEPGEAVTITVASDGRPRIPSLIGQPLSNAEAVLDREGWSYVLRWVDTLVASEGERVLALSPGPGRLARPDRTIIEVTVGRDVRPTVPGVTGVTPAEAIGLLQSAGFRVVEQADPVHDPAWIGRVTGQSPGGGQRAAPGTAVTIRVGVDGRVQVPSVLGRAEADAIAALQGLGLEVRVTDRITTVPAEVDRVLLQSVTPGTLVAPGARVELVVGRAPPRPTPAPTPALPPAPTPLQPPDPVPDPVPLAPGEGVPVAPG